MAGATMRATLAAVVGALLWAAAAAGAAGAGSSVSSTYEWDSRWAGEQLPCVRIPANLSLCQGVGYERMRVPDLLEHDSVAEIVEQSASWLPLLNVRCDRHAQRFLCSLFAAVCVEPPVQPCRSLCRKVRSGCEARMNAYGFPWPRILACDRFPRDNDMCITAEMADSPSEEKCEICEQANTAENIVDHYCRSDFAVRGKLVRGAAKHRLLAFQKVKLFKATTVAARDALRPDLFELRLHWTDDCCGERMRDNRNNRSSSGGSGSYLLMGTDDGHRLRPTFVMPWQAKRSKSFKKSIRMLRTVNCTNPSTVIDAKKGASRSPALVPVRDTMLESKNQTESGKGSRPNKKRSETGNRNGNGNRKRNNNNNITKKNSVLNANGNTRVGLTKSSNDE